MRGCSSGRKYLCVFKLVYYPFFGIRHRWDSVEIVVIFIVGVVILEGETTSQAPASSVETGAIFFGNSSVQGHSIMPEYIASGPT